MAERNFDLLISGAGPAGAATALALRGSGLKVALVERSNFPRDKVCGDFVMARGVRLVNELVPGFQERIEDFPAKAVNRSTLLYIDDLDPLRWDWVQRSYTIRREHFDHLLLEEALKVPELHFYPGEKTQWLRREKDHIVLETAAGNRYRAPWIIGADGAHSPVARQLGNFKLDHAHYGGSVRAYFQALEGLDMSANEVFIHRAVVPGYFWLFPLSRDAANLGLGMHSRYLTQHKVNLKELFYRFIEAHPVLQERMAKARQEGPVKGFGLPFYSRRWPVAGPGYFLTGDAASLIDPTNGEGIYQALYSGRLAAQHFLQLAATGDYSSRAAQAYARNLHRRFWREMQLKSWIVRYFAEQSNIHRWVGQACLQQSWIRLAVQRLM